MPGSWKPRGPKDHPSANGVAWGAYGPKDDKYYWPCFVWSRQNYARFCATKSLPLKLIDKGDADVFVSWLGANREASALTKAEVEDWRRGLRRKLKRQRAIARLSAEFRKDFRAAVAEAEILVGIDDEKLRFDYWQQHGAPSDASSEEEDSDGDVPNTSCEILETSSRGRKRRVMACVSTTKRREVDALNRLKKRRRPGDDIAVSHLLVEGAAEPTEPDAKDMAAARPVCQPVKPDAESETKEAAPSYREELLNPRDIPSDAGDEDYDDDEIEDDADDDGEDDEQKEQEPLTDLEMRQWEVRCRAESAMRGEVWEVFRIGRNYVVGPRRPARSAVLTIVHAVRHATASCG
eukprot:CAMPEP_0118877156 /NCGR_PEP_ID=MMETSP1163-20130328/17558_1 /TAXON_ID=124430 /ORGANISM="Phaeomonas parva, Strain CCMP2877" /LENGTH=349 /DNA_ID=CAMNT_0006812843 /DNA_START=279 /DNA_END=1325 /DNA_ORIENTATION=+